MVYDVVFGGVQGLGFNVQGLMTNFACGFTGLEQ